MEKINDLDIFLRLLPLVLLVKAGQETRFRKAEELWAWRPTALAEQMLGLPVGAVARWQENAQQGLDEAIECGLLQQQVGHIPKLTPMGVALLNDLHRVLGEHSII